MSSATYRTLLRTPGATAFFLTAAVGRFGIAMTSLGIVWLVHARTGSYTTAGMVTGGFAVAEAAAGPQIARLIDRFGQTRVLPPALLAHAAAVASLLALVATGTPHWLMTAGGVLVGATIPQLGALSAARWAALLRDERAAALPTAFALESLANELSYLAGPVLVSMFGACGYPAAGTVLAAVLVVGGGLCFAAQCRTAPPTSGAPGRHRTGHSLLRPGFAILVGVNLAIGGFFGAMQISVTAFAVEHGAAGTAAALFAVSSCAGLLAGWLYGRRRWRAAQRVQLAAAAAGLAVGCLPLLVAGSAFELGFGVALTGLAVPLILVLCSVLAEAAVDQTVLTQAFVWLNSASAAGSAGAAAAAGWAVDASGAHAGFAVAAMATGVMAVLAVAGLRALRVPHEHAAARQLASAPVRHPPEPKVPTGATWRHVWLAMVPSRCHTCAMDLTPYVSKLSAELAVAAEAGGEDARALAKRLIAPLDSAMRLTLLEALSSAADEITRDLAPGSVELRLRGLEPSFIVTPPPGDDSFADSTSPAPAGPPSAVDADDGAMARINVRLPEQLKARIEEAAAKEKISANVWLVRAAAAVLDSASAHRPVDRGRIGGQHFTGWVR
jgi:MFS family permease